MFVHPLDEAELRVMVKNLYREHGKEEVLKCIETMEQCRKIILETLADLEREDK